MYKSEHLNDIDAVAVIGVSCQFPGAKNAEEFWKNINSATESVEELSVEELVAEGLNPNLVTQKDYVNRVSRLKNVDLFDADFFAMTAREASITSPSQRLLLQCAYEAIEDASYSPDKCTRNIGVFVGVNRCDEWQKRLYALASTEEGNGARQLQWFIANDLDYAATRISHKLNLHGPSLNISTACSTSLVAIHQACRSLLSYESDMALAGGANVALEQYHGYLYQYGGIQSNDGYCRAFDEKSSGTLFGSGAGVVLLKRLDEALADGDHIHGIIRGSAINNDGSAKVGFTAPSVTGQMQVISSALAVADVDPEDIELIEAHGTGTSLGDPIEIQALTHAYRRKTKKNQYCAIGSVKTNIGHLGSAAGIAGFIKALYALKNKTLPASLHFNAPNPEIDFASTPFYVSHKSQPWEEKHESRFAGVSSFGVGGTNAHIVLQEAPERQLADCTSTSYVLVLSAKTKATLQTYAKNLATYLKAHPETNLRDFTYSITCGRNSFDYKFATSVSSIADAIQQLDSIDSQKIVGKNDNVLGSEKTNICFMFPGQGSQYVNMCRDLYSEYSIFKNVVDECCNLINKNNNVNLLDNLFATDEDLERKSALLYQTDLTQPALFVIEYALARLWMTFGIEPTSMIGHSIGEYVAACLAGVFSLEDALNIVCVRGALMQSMAHGAMLAVASNETTITPYIEDCEIAAVNSADWVVIAGTDESIKRASDILTAQNIFCRRLHTSHAFHSRMMEPILEEFTRALEKIQLSAPKIPFASNLTGQWIKNSEATNPLYWAKHLRNPVKFHAGIHEILKLPNTILVEVGPGQALTSLVETNNQAGIKVVSSTRTSKQTQNDKAFFLNKLGNLACLGVDIELEKIFSGELCSRLSLPVYPFDLKRYWIEPVDKTKHIANAQMTIIADNSQFNAQAGTEKVSPTNNVNLKDFLKDSVANLLGTQDFSETIPLVELGINSLMAIELRTKINSSLGTDCISVVDLLDESATICNLFDRLSNSENVICNEENQPHHQDQSKVISQEVEASDAIFTKASVNEFEIQPDLSRAYEPFPLTDIQQAYWIGRTGSTDGGNVATYAYIEMNVNNLDIQKYEASLNKLILRHHMLRMVVLENGLQQFLQQTPEYKIPVTDLSQLSTSDREAILLERRDQMSHQVLDTSRWPLFEVVISKTGDNNYRLHYGFDFMIVDVLSLMVFFRDLFLIYVGRENKLEPLELCFRDYVLAEQNRRRSDQYSKSKDYWLKKIDSLAMPPQLPLTKDVAQVTNPKYVRRDFTLDADTWSRLKSQAKRYKVTPSVLIATAYSEVLRQWTNPQEFTLNLTIFNRPRLHRQMNDLIGDFTSSVLLQVDMARLKAFSESAKAIQSQLLMDLEHRLFNGVEVLRALNSSKGGYQSVVMPYVLTSALGLDQYSESRLAGMAEEELQLYEEMMELGHTISQTSQVWLDHVVREKNGCLLCNWDALEEIFPEQLLDDMFCAYYDRLIQLANEGASAWEVVPQSHVPSYQLANRAQVNATEKPVSAKLLHELLDDAVDKYPNNIAVINDNTKIPYWRLRSTSLTIADRLKAYKTKPNTLVAIVMDKGWEQIVSVFGILYAGAAYMPIDASLPPERIMTLLEQGEVNCVLTQPHIKNLIAFPQNIHCEVITAQLLASTIDKKNYTREYFQQSTDLAYVLFTSGSTGVPKGVMISHQSAVNTVLDINEKFSITESDKAIGINALNFDLSVYDVFGLLAVGGGLVIPDYKRALDPKHWLDLVDTHQITFWNTVPAIVQLYVEELESREKSIKNSGIQLRYIFMSGDWIPVTLPPRINRVLPQTLAVSLGGPTETTVWSIFSPIHELPKDSKSVPYGKPLANRAHYILHSDLTPCPDWVTGMIYTGGRIGVAEGYWKDRERTNQVFINHPDTGERIYCTGDTGRFLPNGNIEFVGRIDNQVKIQGHRIELGEIEFTLRKIPEIQEAIVIPVAEYKNDNENKIPNKLIAFYKNKESDNSEEETFEGDVLLDPLSIALFKMEQHGIRSFPAELPSLTLSSKPESGTVLRLGSKGEENLAGAVDTASLGKLLSCLAQVQLEDYSLPKYFYPSAGSAHPIQTYIYIGENSSLSSIAGIYYYDARQHELVLFKQTNSVPSEWNNAEFTVVLASYNPAITPLYGTIGSSRFNYIESGHIENLLVGTAATEAIKLEPIDFNSHDISCLIEADSNYAITRVLSASINADDVADAPQANFNIIERQSYRNFIQESQSADGLKKLLKSIPGFNQRFSAKDYPGIYLYIKPERFNDLQGGFYSYDQLTGTLRLLESVSSQNQPDNLQYSRNQAVHTSAAFSFIFTADGENIAQQQQQMMAVGYLAQNLQNTSTNFDIGLCSTAGVKKSLVESYLGLRDSDEIIYCLEGGCISPEQKFIWVTESMHQEKTQTENNSIRDLLKQQLPYYMVPSSFIKLKQFPLTANGKIDRKALVNLNQKQATPETRVKISPRNELEQKILAIWSSVLVVEDISMDDNLFELGGDSLSATKLISEIQKEFHVGIPLHKLFADPTVSNTAAICQVMLDENSATETELKEASKNAQINVSDVLVDFGVMTENLVKDAVLKNKYSVESLNATSNSPAKTILLTGASGFLGAYVLHELLERTSAKIICLVRSRDGESSRNRLIDNLKKYSLWQIRYADSINVIEGDIALADFGLKEDEYRDLSGKVDQIYHVASLVNYARSYGDLKKVNVTGAHSIIDFAFTKRLKKVVVISTKYVCIGLTPSGINVVKSEGPIPDPSGMFIGYTQSKWVVEQLFEKAGEQGLPVSIIRPGQITAAYKGETVLPDDAFHHLIELFVNLNASPASQEWNDGVVDILPVDFAAKTIVDIGNDQTSYGKYFNLINPYASTLDEFFMELNKWWGNESIMGNKVRLVRQTSFDDWAEQCTKAIEVMEDKSAAYVLSRFFVKTEFGWFIKGLFLKGDLEYNNVTSASTHYLTELQAINESIWTTYFRKFKEKITDYENSLVE